MDVKALMFSVGYILFIVIFFGGLLLLNDLYDDPGDMFDKWIDRKLDSLWSKLKTPFTRKKPFE